MNGKPEPVKPINSHLWPRSQHGHMPLPSRRNPSMVILPTVTWGTCCWISFLTPVLLAVDSKSVA